MAKYNIGDKVVAISNINFYGNEFSYDKLIKTETVSDANEEIFVVRNQKINSDLRRHNMYSQQHGHDFSLSQFTEHFYHAEKDIDEISQKIENYKEEFLEIVEKNRLKEIERTRSKIKSLVDRLDKLESGRYSVRNEGILFNIQDYIDKVDNYISKKINEQD